MPEDLPLTERYLRYKHGTEKITSWLAATASKCCDISQLVSALSTRSARTSAAQGGTVEILAAELVGLTLAIVKSTPAVPIPTKILTALAKTIEGRQVVADTYKTKASKQCRENAKKDSGHQHFIEVLIEVQGHLESAARTFQSLSDEHSSSADLYIAADPLMEKTATLKIQDPAKKPLSDCDFREVSPSKSASLSKATFVLKKQDHEDGLACLCFLDELKSVRLSVHQTWKRYLDGEVTFMLASMTTHAAVCLLKCAEVEFTLVNPAFDSWVKIADLLRIEVGEHDHQPTVYLANKDADGPLSEFEDLDLAALLAYTGSEAMTLLEHRIDWSDKNRAHLHGKGPRAGLRKYKRHFKRKLAQHPFVSSMLANIFTGYIPELPSYGRRKEFFVGIYEYCKSTVLPTWLVVACQMYIDVADILGPHFHDGLAVFQQSLRGLEAQKVVMAVHRQQYPGEDHELDEETMAYFEDSALMASNARKVLQVDVSDAQSGDVLSPRHKQQEKFLILMGRNPLTMSYGHLFPLEVGCSAYNAKLDSLCRALSNPHVELYLHTMAFVYQAGRALGLLSIWPDMEFLITTQCRKSPLAPASTERPEALFESFRASVGMPGIRTMQRSVERGVDPKLPPFGAIEPESKIARGFMKRSRSKSTSLPSSRKLQVLLHELATEKLLGARMVSGQSNSAPTDKPTFEPVELLSTFTEHFQSEEPILHFDYIRFWSDCGILCDKILKDICGPRYPRSKSLPGSSMLVGFDLLREAAFLKEHPAKVAGSCLAGAAKLIEVHIGAKGDRYSRAAKIQSSGHLPTKPTPIDGERANLTEEQRETLERVKKAGTSILASGGVIVVHHPRLTVKELKFKASVWQDPCLTLPKFMYDGEEPLRYW